MTPAVAVLSSAVGVALIATALFDVFATLSRTRGGTR